MADQLSLFPASARKWLPEVAAIAAVIVATGVGEFMMGRELICPCGYVRLWDGSPKNSQNSQHLTDWYTFTHVIHGLLLYGLGLWLLGRRRPLSHYLLLAVVLECAWETFENTDFVIDRYRVADALYYHGDSILNSMSDIAASVLGLRAASRLPGWATVLLAIGLQGASLWAIRDNLLLNLLLMLHSFQSIIDWQAGG